MVRFFPEDQQVMQSFLPSVLEGSRRDRGPLPPLKTGSPFDAYKVLTLPERGRRSRLRRSPCVTDAQAGRHLRSLRLTVEIMPKNEFLAMLAHELRNPLAPISNAAGMLRLGGGDGDALRSASDTLDRQVRQLARLVDDLLDMSRITRGTIELRREPIELETVVHQAIETVRPLFNRMHQELTVAVPPHPTYLDADPARLAQVVGNLLNNASKFTDKGGHIWLPSARGLALP